ncbi:Thromboxane-A synthase [Labeo rohita]|uniref:Cytochrome P450 3A n=1 Tax=Labeo rohita TaxID=84645 RepID=A0ABQ8LS13_LABRO|nr:Thromboxane-A synthase [Labeo rohita]
MVPLINTATETLVKNLKSHAESGNSFNIHKCFGCFTMDVIASVAFGTQVDSQNNPDDPFVHQASKFFAFTFFRPVMIFFMAFPFLLQPLAGLLPNKSRDEMNSFFIKCIQKMIKQRDDLPPEQRRRDFLQLMLDVRATNKHLSVEHFDVVNDADEQDCTDQGMDNGQENEPGHESTKRTQQKRMMTEDEVVGQSFIFLLAGYETSSNTLAFACYLLALHPECQKKLQEEVDEFFSRHVYMSWRVSQKPFTVRTVDYIYRAGNKCFLALERLDGDEEEGQMWEEEPLNQYIIGGMIFGSLTLLFHAPPTTTDKQSCIGIFLPSDSARCPPFSLHSSSCSNNISRGMAAAHRRKGSNAALVQLCVLLSTLSSHSLILHRSPPSASLSI